MKSWTGKFWEQSLDLLSKGLGVKRTQASLISSTAKKQKPIKFIKVGGSGEFGGSELAGDVVQ